MNDSGHRLWRMERDVGRQPRDAFVHALKRLQVGQVHHQKKSLLERVCHLGCHVDHDAKQL
jgi:hypothetical protein